MLYQDLSGKVIGCIIGVHGELGPGLLEAPYHNALFYELKAQGLHAAYNAAFPVFYKGYQVGDYFADLVVDSKIIVEVKAVRELTDIHRAQIINYLRLAGLRVGLLVNFQGTRVKWERLVL